MSDFPFRLSTIVAAVLHSVQTHSSYLPTNIAVILLLIETI